MGNRSGLGQAQTRRRKRFKGKAQPDLPDGREGWAAKHDFSSRSQVELQGVVQCNLLYSIFTQSQGS